jgi:hypothetical protein
MSFGEGWDLPMMEAAASNLQLIAPAHSAYLAYLTPETAHLIPSRPVPALFVGDPAHLALFAGAHWWKPDEEVAARTIRASIDGSARSKGPTREQVALRYTWERATGELLTILDEAAHPPPARARRLLPRLSRRG